MENDTYLKWLTQLRKGYLELCVLVILRQKHSSYGFEMLQLFHQAGLEINEGTLYPLLNRMQKSGWLVSNWETPIDSGHPRRFYQLSKEGLARLPDMLSTQLDNQQSFEKLMELK
ncbi:MAG: PadR family transcriptional regulator PadR [Gammaproteobacteria bacterium]|jgi:PadR family transcriptional regulator PadR